MINYLKATAVLCKRLVKVCYKLPLYKRLAKVCYKCVISLTPFTDSYNFSVNLFRGSNLYYVEENGNLRSVS